MSVVRDWLEIIGVILLIVAILAVLVTLYAVGYYLIDHGSPWGLAVLALATAGLATFCMEVFK